MDTLVCLFPNNKYVVTRASLSDPGAFPGFDDILCLFASQIQMQYK